MSGHFADRLLEAIERKRSHVVVGLDPDYGLMPPDLRRRYDEYHGRDTGMMAACFREFLLGVVDAVKDEAVAVKPQTAFFEAIGHEGVELFEYVVRAASDAGLLVIADVKRGDIGSTAEAYARAHLDRLGADAVTVNPWFGTDGLEPFLARARDEGKGVFILVKTSNPSSAEVQDLRLAGGELVHERVAALVARWGEGTEGRLGYASVGAVVGGTHPEQARALRRSLPGVPFLVPGYGAQGTGATDLVGVFDASGTGTVVNAARSILYAYRGRRGSWQDAARAETTAMRRALWRAAGRG